MLPGADEFSEWYLHAKEFKDALRQDTKQDLLRDLGAPTSSTESHIRQDPITDFYAYRASRLRGSLSQIDDEIEVRLRMRDRAVGEIEYQISEAAGSLREFTNWGLGYNVGVDVKRNFLERMLADLRRQRRQEQLRAWEGVISLRKERRKIEEELSEISRREEFVKG